MPYDDLPKRIMACGPFLQRMGLERVRPRQNFSINFEMLHIRRTPVEYPVQGTEHALGFRNVEPLHGLAQLEPYPEQEVINNSNHEKALAVELDTFIGPDEYIVLDGKPSH